VIPHVVIAVVTYRRPGDLAELLPLLEQQAAATPGARVELLVVDNDPDGSAADVARPRPGLPVRYVTEPEPGIAAARNRALREAGDADLLVFVDDDERPHEGWLARMLRTREEHTAAAVSGAVVSAFAGPLEPWVRDGGFFDRRRLPTGTPISVAATNNLLLDLDVVRAEDLSFDAAFGISGGSDTLFTRQLTGRGHRMVWCDEAVVTDAVPRDRMTRDWVLRRAFRSGNSSVRVDVALAASPHARAAARGRGVLRGAVRVVGGTLRASWGVLARRPVQHARGLRTASRGAGMCAAASGVVYREYRRPTASR